MIIQEKRVVAQWRHCQTNLKINISRQPHLKIQEAKDKGMKMIMIDQGLEDRMILGHAIGMNLVDTVS